MNFIRKIFTKRGIENSEESILLSEKNLTPKIVSSGFVYEFDNLDGEKTPLELFDWALSENGSQQAVYLSQLVEEGLATYSNGKFLLMWEDCYYILNSNDHIDSAFLLELPPVKKSKWRLSESGTLTDAGFKLILQGIEDSSQRLVLVNRQYAYCSIGNQSWLVSPEEWLFLKKVDSFGNISESEKNRKRNEAAWGEIRALAIQASTSLSKYLKETLVITTQTLDVNFSRGNYFGSEVVRIEPTFEGAPNNWLEVFDRWGKDQIPEDVDFPTQGGRLQIIFSESVREVLSKVKQEFPNRYATGVKAHAFVRNPFAMLGDHAHSVLKEKQIEEAKLLIGIVPTKFYVRAYQDSDSKINEVVVSISQDYEDVSSGLKREFIKDITSLKEFINIIEKAIEEEQQFFFWKNHSIDVDGDTFTQLENAIGYLKVWESQKNSFIEFDDVYCLENYGEQIEGIGAQKPIYSPYIVTIEKGPWVPENLIPLIKVCLPPNGVETYIQLDQSWVKEFDLKIEAALLDKSEVVIDNKLPFPLKISDAKQLLRDLRQLMDSGNEINLPVGGTLTSPGSDNPKSEPKNGGSSNGGEGGSAGSGTTITPTVKPKVKKQSKEVLLLKDNVNNLKYNETQEAQDRARLLAVPDNFKAALPINFKSGISLKSHQLVGVRWLQYLNSRAPSYARGAVLADDMGLGKTFQLLTVLSAHYQNNPNSPPSLIIAPIALMKNWINESEKFFDNFPEILLLHGKNLEVRKQPKGQISEELLNKKIDSLLKPNWLDSAKVVLTTYEVLRDYEFSLAKQDFYYMICDEAQKIKTPNALVTLAAKKQKAQFRIACTGTPVENSLADLWCLFDFIQPGLLGSLQEFSDRYRKPIEAKRENAGVMKELLRTYIDPQMIRRMKEDIASELPKKIIVSNDKYFFEGKDRERLRLEISPYQRNLYADGLRQLEAAALESDARKRGKLSFAVLHFMKAVCAEPYCLPSRSFELDKNGIEQHKFNSPKIKWLLDTLEIIKAKNEKAIIFTEIREIQRALARFIRDQFGFSPLVINGDTDERQDVIDAFQSKAGFGVIILSPLAAGFGLNIVEANHVIHYSRTWNPAKEGQATDRAYRIGQTKNVHVYCPSIIANDFTTFEDNLDKLMSLKSDLAGDILDGVGQDISVGELMPTGGPATGTSSDVYISIEDVDSLDGNSFEYFCRLLYAQFSVKSEITEKKRGDGGVDLVVFNENNHGFLCQCKHTRLEEIGWDAIKEISAGSPAYQAKYPLVKFQKLAITNRFFNRTARDQALNLSIKLIERNLIEEMLIQYKIPRILLDQEIFRNS